jgi:hypothetical protein
MLFTGKFGRSWHYVLPLRSDLGLAHEVLEMLLHGQRQEGTEHMAADTGVRGISRERKKAYRQRVSYSSSEHYAGYYIAWIVMCGRDS